MRLSEMRDVRAKIQQLLGNPRPKRKTRKHIGEMARRIRRATEPMRAQREEATKNAAFKRAMAVYSKPKTPVAEQQPTTPTPGSENGDLRFIKPRKGL
jgi:hypothetical protein